MKYIRNNISAQFTSISMTADLS